MAGPAAVKIISVQDLGNNSKEFKNSIPPWQTETGFQHRKGKKIATFVSLVKTWREGCGREQHRQDCPGAGSCSSGRGSCCAMTQEEIAVGLFHLHWLRAGGDCPAWLEP